MNYIKNFSNFTNEELNFPEGYFKYHLDNFSFEVMNGGASTGTEYGSVIITFTKDDEEYDVQFDIYQVAGGSDTITFIEIEDILIAKELGIEIDKKDRVGEDDELFQIIYDAYDSKSEGEEGDYKDMTYRIDSVSPEGVIEEGWLEIYIEKNGKSEEISFDIRQDSKTDEWNATFNSDEDEEKCKSLGIELDVEFESEILRAYDSYCNETRYPMNESKKRAQRYKGHKIPGKYLAGPQPGKMKKEIDKFRGKKEYKKDWDADYKSGKGGVGKRVKTKKSKATLAYQKMFGK